MNLREQATWFIDCDPGCDDAIALALAARRLAVDRPVELLTVAGNVGVELTTWNACRVVAACGKAWCVHRGCSGSLSGEAVLAASVHGRDGLGDVPNNCFGINPGKPSSESAVVRLLRLAESSERFVLVSTGPLTNLASALNLMTPTAQGGFWERCEICVVMGGAFQVSGNITPSAEFNSHFDPVAVHLVLESWRSAQMNSQNLAPIYFVPLDITEKVGIPLHDVVDESDKAPCTNSASKFLRAALRKYGQFHARFCRRKDVTRFGVEKFNEEAFLKARVAGKSGLKNRYPFCYLHDPLAMWVALCKERRESKEWWSEARISIDTGQGTGRGRIILNPNNRQDGPSRVPILGTKVNWLDPKKFDRNQRKSFVDDIKALLS